jgi:hypothetical protein
MCNKMLIYNATSHLIFVAIYKTKKDTKHEGL